MDREELIAAIRERYGDKADAMLQLLGLADSEPEVTANVTKLKRASGEIPEAKQTNKMPLGRRSTSPTRNSSY
jgi:hypothetical protein